MARRKFLSYTLLSACARNLYLWQHRPVRDRDASKSHGRNQGPALLRTQSQLGQQPVHAVRCPGGHHG